jgi:hypothetical protein
MPMSRKRRLRMFARWPGLCIHARTVWAGVAREPVPQAMFSPSHVAGVEDAGDEVAVLEEVLANHVPRVPQRRATEALAESLSGRRACWARSRLRRQSVSRALRRDAFVGTTSAVA